MKQHQYFSLFACLFLAILTMPLTLRAAEKPPTHLPPPPLPGAALRFQHLTIDDGLPHNRIDTITEDRYGFMWFGTTDGLARYDGYETTVIRAQPDNPMSLSNPAVSALLSTADGTLWVGTRGGGLNRLDAHSQQFAVFRHTPSDPTSIAANTITALAQGLDGRIWAGLSAQQIDAFDPTTGQFAHYRLPACGERQPIRTIGVAADGTLWLASGGLLSLQPASGIVTCHLTAESAAAQAAPHALADLAIAADGRIWMVDDQALWRYIPSERRWSAFPLVLSATPTAPIPSTLVIDPNGLIWIGTIVHGMYVFDPASEYYLTAFHSDPISSEGPRSAASIRMFLSRDGQIWIGTSNGIDIIDLWQTRFTYYRKGSNQDLNGIAADAPHPLRIKGTGMLERPIRALAGRSDGAIWMGAAHYLTLFEPQKNTYTHYELMRKPRPNVDPSAVDINALIPDGPTSLWVDGVDALLHFDTASERLSEPYRPASYADRPFVIWAIAADQQNHLWMTAFGDTKLYRFDRQTHAFEVITLPVPAEADMSSLRSVIVGPDGQVWVGGRGLLFAYNPATQQTQAYTARPNDPTSIPQSQIVAMTASHNGTIWLATDTGLAQFDQASAQATTRSERDGMPGNLIRAVVEDAQGMIWASSTHGLVQFNPQTQKLQLFTRSDGLQSNEFISGAAAIAPNGQLLFAGDNGLNSFRPEQITRRPDTAGVVLTDVMLFNRSQQPNISELLDRPIWDTYALTPYVLD